MYYLLKDIGLRKFWFGEIKVSKRSINFKVIFVLYIFLVYYKKCLGKLLWILYVLVVLIK